jgi:ABC-type sulfate/molybdate transport systems ATPase subunit
MADNQPNHNVSTPQMGQAEMSALASRLRARAESVLMKDQPHQASDMRTAAALLEQLAHLRTDIQRLADTVPDEVEQQHLRGLLEGL